MRTALIVLAALAVAPAARAGDNDLQIYRLGHPDDIFVCTRCDGTDRTIEPGTIDAQVRFARLTAALGLALVPELLEPGSTTGQSGFEVGFSGHVAFPQLDAAEWPSAATGAVGSPPKALFLPTVSLRKGLGGSLELGAGASFLAGSQIFAVSAQARWGFLEGIAYVPDFALRAQVTRAIGTQELDLTVGGADLTLSKSFGLLGVLRLEPFGQYGLTFINATTGVINFHPQTVDQRDPTAQDGVFHSIDLFSNRYSRFAAGLRLIGGVAVVGLEGSFATGTNAVQKDALQNGAAPPTQTTRQFSASGRFGVMF